MPGAPPGPVFVGKTWGSDLGSQSSGTMWAGGRGEKVCRRSRASPPEGALAMIATGAGRMVPHRRCSRAKCRRNTCSVWRYVYVTLIHS